MPYIPVVDAAKRPRAVASREVPVDAPAQCKNPTDTHTTYGPVWALLWDRGGHFKHGRSQLRDIASVDAGEADAPR